jgi:hypothetical protein
MNKSRAGHTIAFLSVSILLCLSANLLTWKADRAGASLHDYVPTFSSVMFPILLCGVVWSFLTASKHRLLGRVLLAGGFSLVISFLGLCLVKKSFLSMAIVPGLLIDAFIYGIVLSLSEYIACRLAAIEPNNSAIE